MAGQHEHGSKTALSERYEISRPTVYAVGATAEAVLRTHFEVPLLGGAGVTVRVNDAQLRRAVVALRVVAPNAIGDYIPKSHLRSGWPAGALGVIATAT